MINYYVFYDNVLCYYICNWKLVYIIFNCYCVWYNCDDVIIYEGSSSLYIICKCNVYKYIVFLF